MTDRFLLDTNVLSILAPRSKAPDETSARFQDWVRPRHETLFLSCVTLAEVQSGISRLERRRAPRQAAVLQQWMESICEIYGDRILPLTVEAALITGRLLDRAAGEGDDPGFENAAIAATAASEGMTVVTLNARHFRHFGVPFIAPPT